MYKTCLSQDYLEMSKVETSFDSKCNILSELWLNYRNDRGFQDFIVYNDLALPLAFMIAEDIVDDPSDLAKSFIDESFALLMKAASVEDIGFDSLDDILGSIETKD